jgi:GNAT superfamily N-acetyltransferase
MKSRITVRDAACSDAERVSRLLTALAEEFIVPEFSEAGRSHLLAQLAAAEMANRLSSVEYRFQVAEGGEELAGVVAMRGRNHLYYLFVDKAFQRTGVARRLWELARDDSIREGNAARRFTVNASSYAVPAYERLGFRCVGPAQRANGVRFWPMAWLGDEDARR